MFYDPVFLVFVTLPILIISGLASWITKSTFKKYSQVASSSSLTGAEAARKLLDNAGVRNVNITQVGGFLSDHYNPMTHTLALSADVYGSRSLSAIGVACHEAGHALQHANGYLPLHARTAIVPLTNLCSSLQYPILLFGIFMSSPKLMMAGIIMIGMVFIFSLITLPVEWNASSRAKKFIHSAGIVNSSQEANCAGKVLNAAFLTYVAAAVSALLTLLYYLIRSGLLGGSDD